MIGMEAWTGLFGVLWGDRGKGVLEKVPNWQKKNIKPRYPASHLMQTASMDTEKLSSWIEKNGGDCSKVTEKSCSFDPALFEERFIFIFIVHVFFLR